MIQQGFAKHRGRGEGREVGLRLERSKTHVLQPKNPQVFIGEGEGAAPPLGFPPQGWRQPPDAICWQPEGIGRAAPPPRVPTPRGAAALDPI